mgnify:CR=1 FL=1
MLRYIVKRIGLMIITFFIIMTICFVLIRLLPTSPCRDIDSSCASINAWREALGYNKPIAIQYLLYLKHIFQGDFGVGFTIYGGKEGTFLFVREAAKYDLSESICDFPSDAYRASFRDIGGFKEKQMAGPADFFFGGVTHFRPQLHLLFPSSVSALCEIWFIPSYRSRWIRILPPSFLL